MSIWDTCYKTDNQNIMLNKTYPDMTNDFNAPHLRDDLWDVLKGLFDWILGHIPLETYNVCDQINCVEIISIFLILMYVYIWWIRLRGIRSRGSKFTCLHWPRDFPELYLGCPPKHQPCTEPLSSPHWKKSKIWATQCKYTFNYV